MQFDLGLTGLAVLIALSLGFGLVARFVGRPDRSPRWPLAHGRRTVPSERPMDNEPITRLFVAPGNGILAADESTGTTERRVGVGIESTVERRHFVPAA
jgi:hypothetical protein